MNRYQKFEDLPKWVKTELELIHPRTARAVVQEPLPALGQKTILQTMGMPGGHAIMRNYFNRLEGRMLK